jgi:hypothetical protein
MSFWTTHDDMYGITPYVAGRKIHVEKNQSTLDLAYKTGRTRLEQSNTSKENLRLPGGEQPK